MGWFSDTFNPGKKYRKQAARALQRAQFKGGNMTTAGGLSAGFSFGDNGEFYSRQSSTRLLPELQRLLNGLILTCKPCKRCSGRPQT